MTPNKLPWTTPEVRELPADDGAATTLPLPLEDDEPEDDTTRRLRYETGVDVGHSPGHSER